MNYWLRGEARVIVQTVQHQTTVTGRQTGILYALISISSVQTTNFDSLVNSPFSTKNFYMSFFGCCFQG